MIDFLKILILDKLLIESIWSNELLIYNRRGEKVNKKTGEIRKRKVRKWKNLDFTRYDNKLEITGSIHYFFNDGIHNANDFTVDACIRIIHDIKKSLNLDLSKCIIINLEFGVNVLLPFQIRKVIQGGRYHERNEFRNSENLQYSKESSSFTKDGKVSVYKGIKIYAKGLQMFNGKVMAPENTLRFEVTSKRSKYFNKLGIFSLKDLTNRDVYKRLSVELIKEWNNVLLLDRLTDFNGDKRIVKYINSDFWEDILNKSRNSFSYHKKKYFTLLSEYPDNIVASIRILIEAKISAISTPDPKEELVQYLVYVCADNALKTKRSCKITGLDISMQKEKSSMLLHTGLYFYPKCNPETFAMLKRKYLIECWSESEMKNHVGENAHNIETTECKRRRYSDDNKRLFHIYENCIVRFLEVVKMWCIRFGSYIRFRFE